MMRDLEKKLTPVKIVTSAVDPKVHQPQSDEDVEYQDQSEVTSPTESLPQLHSKIGHLAQGNSYKNGLDLAFDRLLGNAGPPEYLAPERPAPTEDEEQEMPAFEPMNFVNSMGDVEDELITEVQEPKQGDTQVDTEEESSFSTNTQILGGLSLDELEQLKSPKTEPVSQDVLSDPEDVVFETHDMSSTPEDDPEDEFTMDDFDRLTQLSPPPSLLTEEATFVDQDPHMESFEPKTEETPQTLPQDQDVPTPDPILSTPSVTASENTQPDDIDHFLRDPFADTSPSANQEDFQEVDTWITEPMDES